MNNNTDYLLYSIIFSVLIFGAFLGALLNIYTLNGIKIFQEWQTLLAGFFAIIAACVAYTGTRQQIKSSTDNHNRLLELQSLQYQHSIFQKNYGLASSILGDLKGLIAGTKDNQYLEGFKVQHQAILAGSNDDVSAFEMTNDYFVVFNSLSNELGLLSNPLPEKICEWYIFAKGFSDTVH